MYDPTSTIKWPQCIASSSQIKPTVKTSSSITYLLPSQIRYAVCIIAEKN